MKLYKYPKEQSILHNIEFINGTVRFYFNDKNKKYGNADGYELILDKNNNPIYDPAVVGTYNMVTYKGIISEPGEATDHTSSDVKLWEKDGTGPNDKSDRNLRKIIGNKKIV